MSTAAEMQWKQMTAQPVICHSQYKRHRFESSALTSLEWAVVTLFTQKLSTKFFKSAYKHCACQVLGYIQPWFWWLNGIGCPAKPSPLHLLLIPLISGIIIYRSHGSGEQCEPSSLCPFIRINKCVQSGVMAVYALYFSWDDAAVLHTNSWGIYGCVWGAKNI